MAKSKYVTDDYIEKIEHYLYNNLPIPVDKIIPNGGHKFNKSVIKGLLKPGEKYTKLEEPLEHIAITNFGRLVNTHKINQFSVRFSSNTIHVYVSHIKVVFEEIFENQGWEFDLKTIELNYKKYKWKHIDKDAYKGYYV